MNPIYAIFNRLVDVLERVQPELTLSERTDKVLMFLVERYPEDCKRYIAEIFGSN